MQVWYQSTSMTCLISYQSADGVGASVQQPLCCGIPPNEIGQQWRAFNVQLAKGSDGLLAPVNGDDLEVVTARGSHTTAGVRCMIAGTRGIHERVCVNGRVCKSKITSQQPSMSQPIDKGMRYTVLRWQVVVACPVLMDFLARTGNASHGAERTMTVLQAC